MQIAKPRMKIISINAAIIPLIDEPVSSTDAKAGLSLYY